MFPHFAACRINKKILVPMEAHLLERKILNSDRNYILDCGTEIFLWLGMTTLVSERKTSATALEVSQMKSGNFLFCCTAYLCRSETDFDLIFARIMCIPKAGHQVFAQF